MNSDSESFADRVLRSSAELEETASREAEAQSALDTLKRELEEERSRYKEEQLKLKAEIDALRLEREQMRNEREASRLEHEQENQALTTQLRRERMVSVANTDNLDLLAEKLDMKGFARGALFSTEDGIFFEDDLEIRVSVRVLDNPLVRKRYLLARASTFKAPYMVSSFLFVDNSIITSATLGLLGYMVGLPVKITSSESDQIFLELPQYLPEFNKRYIRITDSLFWDSKKCELTSSPTTPINWTHEFVRGKTVDEILTGLKQRNKSYSYG